MGTMTARAVTGGTMPGPGIDVYYARCFRGFQNLEASGEFSDGVMPSLPGPR